MFDGTDLVPPGIVDCATWRADRYPPAGRPVYAGRRAGVPGRPRRPVIRRLPGRLNQVDSVARPGLCRTTAQERGGAMTTPVTTGPRFSDPAATATSWDETRARRWRARGLLLILHGPGQRPPARQPARGRLGRGVLYFCTGEPSEKAHNLSANPHVVLTTGCATGWKGVDSTSWSREMPSASPMRTPSSGWPERGRRSGTAGGTSRPGATPSATPAARRRSWCSR